MDENVKGKAKAIFGKNAEAYVQSAIHAKGDDLPLLVDWLEPEPDWVALDIATGGGHVSKTLSPHVKTVISTDLTERMLENTARHLNASHNNILYVVADAEAMPFLSNTFDVIVCRIAPHHFPDPAKFISEVARLLKTGGKFALIDNVAPEDSGLAEFMNRTEKLRDDSHARCLSRSEWRRLLTSNGLEEAQAVDRKKTFHYEPWVHRTAESDDQVQRVTEHLLGASEEEKAYFNIETHGNSVRSFTIDEWIAMCIKTPH